MRKALDLDPLSFDANWFIGWVYLSLGRLDEAEEVAHRMVRLDSNSWIGYQLLAWTESVRGKWPEATAAYERSAAIEGGPASLSVLCWCYEKSGRPIDARHTLERLEHLTTTRIVPPTWLALAYDAVGADAQARACMASPGGTGRTGTEPRCCRDPVRARAGRLDEVESEGGVGIPREEVVARLRERAS